MIDFEKIPIELKNLLVHSLLLPFWYITIYLFLPELYITGDFILIISTCICLTISSAFVFTFFLLLKQPKKREKNWLDKDICIVSCIYQIIWFSFLLMASYVSKKISNNTFEFYGFVLFYFLPLFLFIYVLSLDIKRDKNLEEKTK